VNRFPARTLAATAVWASVLLSSSMAVAAPPITPIAAERGKTVSASGKLESGVTLDRLDWAWDSSVACFPGTEQTYFDGRHVFFRAEIPTRSRMFITVTPKDPTVNLSAYAYEIGVGAQTLPPDLTTVVSCESERKWDRPKRGKSQDHSRVLPQLTAIANPYSVIIAVTSPKAVTAGEFDVAVRVE
jgi:hypothetical protein